MRRLAASILALASFAAAEARAADRRRIALVNGSDVLERQVQIALSSWGVDVEHVDWTSLGAAMPGAAREARRVAEVHHVDAVVWVSDGTENSALWIYDVSEGHAVSRPLRMPPPTDTAEAASVALTLKTLMRSTTAAPPSERIGAGAERPVGPAGTFRAEADGGARFLSTTASVPELRVGLTALWWPRFLGQYAAAAIGFAAGPGLTVQHDDFSGHLLDFAIAPAARFRIPLGSRFALEPGAGVTIHLMHLDGAAVSRNQAVGPTRVNPSIDGGALFSFALTGGVSVGVRATASYLLSYQRYEVDHDPVLELNPLQLSAALVLGARLN